MLTKKEYKVVQKLIEILSYRSEKWDLTSAEKSTMDALFNLRREYRSNLPDGPENGHVIWQIKNADIMNPYWAVKIVEDIDSRYARGYLIARLGVLGGLFSENTEDYREALLADCANDIWK